MGDVEGRTIYISTTVSFRFLYSVGPCRHRTQNGETLKTTTRFFGVAKEAVYN